MPILETVRCILPESVHVMALTATVTKTTFASITSSLGMVNSVCVMESPHKLNVTYRVVAKQPIKDLVKVIVCRFKERHQHEPYPKTIIFCRRCVHNSAFV